jgi:hypothetical protein
MAIAAASIWDVRQRLPMAWAAIAAHEVGSGAGTERCIRQLLGAALATATTSLRLVAGTLDWPASRDPRC